MSSDALKVEEATESWVALAPSSAVNSQKFVEIHDECTKELASRGHHPWLHIF